MSWHWSKGSQLPLSSLLSKQLKAELLRFGVFLLVGGGSALLNLLIVGILTVGLRWPYFPAALIATEASVFQGFLLNDRLTFHDLAGSAGSWARRCLRFHTAALAGQVLTLVLATGLITALHFIPLYAQAISLAIMTVFNFTIQRFLTYARHSKNTPRETEPLARLKERNTLRSGGSQGMLKKLLLLLNASWLKLKPHAIPLGILCVAAALGQIATLMQHPLVATFPDSTSYLQVAQGCAQVPGTHLLPVSCTTPGILGSPTNLIQPFRTPGYPLFLAAIIAVLGDHLARVVVAQALIALLAVLECYLLAFRLSKRRWVACIVGSAIGVNLSILSWERTILSEALSWWVLITLFLCYERFLRRPGFGWGITVAIVGFAAVMIRPFNIIIPFLLLLLALLRAWRSKEFRRYWKSVAVSAALLCVCLLSYMGLNASLNGYFGLSYDPNATLLGKVMEYHLYTLPVPQEYVGIQSDIQTYMKSGPAEPWFFADRYYPTRDYYADNMGYPGNYARYVILHNPIAYLMDSIPDLNQTWLAPAHFYPVESSEPRWILALINISAIELESYWLLPIFLIVLAIWVWRRPQDIERFLMLALAVTVIVAIALAAMGNYAEYYRVRSPVDWAMVLLAGILLAQALVFVAQREGRASSIPVGQYAGLDNPQVRSALEEADELLSNEEFIARQDTLKLAVQQIRMGDSLIEPDPQSPEISIVLPCLNEEKAIGGCIENIKEIIYDQNLSAEILVVDNASTDRSAQIARAHGARVVYQPLRGYGNAYLKGFAEARGKYIVMADADNTYDFHEIEAFVESLRQGYDLVMGNRFSGRMAKGAMTWSHRYIGNPILSGMLNLFFHTGVRDAHCGMRAFKIEAYQAMRLQTGGMEFASEMVINAAKAGLKITERPIAYHPRIGETKLRTVRDGWRHLRFMLLYSPTHLFLIPGAVLMLIGLLVLGVLLPGPFPLFGHRWDVHTMILASVVTLIGLQIVSLGLFARFFSLTEELDGEHDRLLRGLTRWFSLERGLLIGSVIFGIGVVMDVVILIKWIAVHLGPLDEVRPAIFATTLIVIGTQVLFGSFFLSFLQFKKSLSKNVQEQTRPNSEPLSVL